MLICSPWQKVADVWKVVRKEPTGKKIEKFDSKLSNFVLNFVFSDGNGFLFLGERFEKNETHGFKSFVCALEKKD